MTPTACSTTPGRQRPSRIPGRGGPDRSDHPDGQPGLHDRDSDADLLGDAGGSPTAARRQLVDRLGNVNQSSEVSAAGSQLFEAQTPNGSESYRSFRFPWSATPATPPSVAVSATAGGSLRSPQLERRDRRGGLAPRSGSFTERAGAAADRRRPRLRDGAAPAWLRALRRRRGARRERARAGTLASDRLPGAGPLRLSRHSSRACHEGPGSSSNLPANRCGPGERPRSSRQDMSSSTGCGAPGGNT